MRHIYILSIFAVNLIFGSVTAQEIEFKASNFKDKKDEFKAINTKIEEANGYLELANDAIAVVHHPENNFKKALKLYLEADKFNDKSAKINMNIGNCYLYSNEKYKAIPYIKKAFELNPETDQFIHFMLGQVYQLEENWDDAIKEYKIYEGNAKSKYVEEYKKILAKYIKECKHGKELSPVKNRYWVEFVPELSSAEDDFNPTLSIDGEVLMFNSRRKNANGPNEFGVYDSDIYTSTYKNEKWTTPKSIGAPLNTKNDDAASSLAYDGQRLLLWKTDAENSSTVFESKLNGTSWSEPKEKMSYIVKKAQNTTYACYEPLDIKVHYITDKSGDRNIDFSGLMVQMDNKWGEGKSVSHSINSQFHEESVYIHPDGRTMYFSSQGHNSMGGSDIFVVRKNDLEQWDTPVNLGYPINTPYDDVFFSATANGKYAYISSNRPNGSGGMDIYKVTFWGAEKDFDIATEDYLLASIAKPIKDNSIAKQVAVEKNSLTVFKGTVIDAISRKPVEAELEILDLGTSKPIASFKSNSATGKFLLSLPGGKNYAISVKKEGYLFHSENFDVAADADFNMISKEIELKNIKVGSKIALRNVFFATGKADVTRESYPELDRLVQLMKDVPGLKVEVSGHTDNQGSDDLNTKLSQSRAEAVKAYLSTKGISAARLQAKGYGPSTPISTNDNEEGRRNNRRTELEIIAN